MLAGSHRRYVAFGGRTPDDNYRTSLRAQEYGVPDHTALAELDRGGNGDIGVFTGNAGSVAFFDCNLMHGSPDNISPRSRTNAFIVYNAWTNRLDTPYGTEQPRPAHIAERAPVSPI